MDERAEAAARVTIDAAIKVHRALGPGLLESAYEHCLAHELELRGVPIERQVGLPIVYEGLQLEVGYRLDLLVDQRLIVEIKAVEALNDIHQAQLLTYMRFADRKLGLLMNFNQLRLKDGLRRFVL